MGIYDKILDAKRWNANAPTINDHFVDIRQIFPKLFEGKSFNTYMQMAVKDASKVLEDAKVTDEQMKAAWARIPMGRGAITRTNFVAAVEKALQEAMKGLEPLEPARAVQSDYATLRANGGVVMANTSLEAKLDRMTRTKVASVFDYGNTYGGHGPTRNLGPGVLHAHVGGGDGIAFSWTGDVLTIHGYGVKSDSAPSGSSGYSWTTR